MKPEPVVRAMRKAKAEHAKTPLGQLEALQKLRSKWERRHTIAENKLRDIRYDIEEMATDLARKATNERDTPKTS